MQKSKFCVDSDSRQNLIFFQRRMLIADKSAAVIVEDIALDFHLIHFSDQPFLLISENGKIGSLISVDRLDLVDQIIVRADGSLEAALQFSVLLGPEDSFLLTATKNISLCFFKHFRTKKKLMLSLSVKKLSAPLLRGIVKELQSFFESKT